MFGTQEPQKWVAVKEPKLSYHMQEMVYVPIMVTYSTQGVQVPNNFRFLAPKAIKDMAFETWNLKHWVLVP